MTPATTSPDDGSLALAARASLVSHQLVGWIFWDTGGIRRYAALGVPDGAGYYIATRAAPLAPAGDAAVIAAFGSISPIFIRYALGLARQHTTFEAAYRVRNDAVVAGLEQFAPSVAAGLGDYSSELWAVVDSLPLTGRVLFAAHADADRCAEQPALSAWLALNCIREWRGDTHWALVAAAGLSGVAAGLLHDAWMGYPSQWIPRSRGAGDADIAEALAELESRGLAEGGTVSAAGIEFRDDLERQTDLQSAIAWQRLGPVRTVELCELIEPSAPALMQRIDETAGPNWMPAARSRRR
jgi:hypothetical protein